MCTANLLEYGGTYDVTMEALRRRRPIDLSVHDDLCVCVIVNCS